MLNIEALKTSGCDLIYDAFNAGFVLETGHLSDEFRGAKKDSQQLKNAFINAALTKFGRNTESWQKEMKKQIDTAKTICGLILSSAPSSKSEDTQQDGPWKECTKLMDDWMLESYRVIDTSSTRVIHYHRGLKNQKIINKQALDSALNRMPGGSADEAGGRTAAWYRTHEMTSQMKYEPGTPKFGKAADGSNTYNLYTAPKFTAVAPESKDCPDIVLKHIKHMVRDDDSVQYVLDWCAQSIRSQCAQWLLLIGEGGSGKGMLCTLMSSIHNDCHYKEGGDRPMIDINAATFTNQLFDGHFNGGLENKRLVIVNEFKLKTEQATQRTKLYADPTMTIEGKGEDARIVRNTISWICGSNQLDSVKLEKNQRRVSWVDCYGCDVKDLFPTEEAMEEHCQAFYASWEAFGAYLYHHHEIKNNMGIVWMSPRGREMWAQSRPDWMDLIVEWAHDNPGREIRLKDMKQETGLKAGRPTIQAGIQQYNIDNSFSLIRKGSVDYIKSNVGQAATDKPSLTGKVTIPADMLRRIDNAALYNKQDNTNDE